MIIKETYALIATNTDILSAPSRLTSIPHAGMLSLEISATDADATNFGQITLQLPDGSLPFEDLIIPYNAYSTSDLTMHNDTELAVQVPVIKGGHILLAYTENGTVAFCYVIATLTF